MKQEYIYYAVTAALGIGIGYLMRQPQPVITEVTPAACIKVIDIDDQIIEAARQMVLGDLTGGSAKVKELTPVRHENINLCYGKRG